ncbi:MAG: hypothetical protein ACI8TX_002783, partial [Hyphomicrobiaceae bacterium]
AVMWQGLERQIDRNRRAHKGDLPGWQVTMLLVTLLLASMLLVVQLCSQKEEAGSGCPWSGRVGFFEDF